MNKLSSALLCILFAIALAPAQRAHAATKFFSGTGPWDTTTSNWATLPGGPYNTTFANGDDAVFEGTAGTVTIVAVSPLSITFSVDGYVLTGGTITISNANTIFRVDSPRTATINAVLAGSATPLQILGTGTLIIGGTLPNTYSGNMLIDMSGAVGNSNVASVFFNKTAGVAAAAGPVQMGNNNTNQCNLRMGASNQFAPGVVLTFANATNFWSRFDLLGTSQSLDGVVSTLAGAVIQNERLGAGATAPLALGGTTGSGTLTVGSAGTFSYNGYIRDEDDSGLTFVLNIVKTGSGTQTFSNGTSGARAYYTGTTTVNAGTLRLVDLNNASGTLFNSSLQVNAGAILEINSNIAFATRWNYGKTISGAGTINKTGAGVFGIGHSTPGINNFAGQINIVAGRIHNDNVTANWTGCTANVNVAAGAQLDLRANDITLNNLTGAGEIWNSNVTGNATGGMNLTVGVLGGSSTFTGIIRGNASGGTDGLAGDVGITRITKAGAGTFTMTAANTYNGVTQVNAGAVTIQGGASIHDTAGVVSFANAAGAVMNLNSSESIGALTGGGLTGGNINLNANTLTVGGANTNTQYDGVISGTGGLTKIGAGAFTLTGTHTYTGATNVNAGRVLLPVGGSIQSVKTVANGASENILITAAGSQWSCLGATYAAGLEILSFNFSSTVAPSTTVAPYQVNGNLAFTGTVQVTVSGGLFTTGTFPLIKYTGTLSGTVPSSVILQPHVTGTLVNNVGNKSIDLNVTSAGQPLTWAQGNQLWDINVSANWKDSANNVTTYQETAVGGDSVVFEDTQSGPSPVTVTLNTTVNPTALTGNNSTKDFIVTGTGGISGATELRKQGTGTLTLATPNSYVGPTTVTGGTLQIGNGANTGSLSTVTNLTISAPGNLQYFRSDTGVTLGNSLFGNGTLTLKGTGNQDQTDYVFNMNAANFTGAFAINSNARGRFSQPVQLGNGVPPVNISNNGQLYITNPGTYSNPITMSGTGWKEATYPTGVGALRIEGGIGTVVSGPITMTGDSRIGAHTGAIGTISGVISGNFNVEASGGGDIQFIGGNSNTYTGTTIVNNSLPGGTTGILSLRKTGGAIAVRGPVQMGANNNQQPNLRMFDNNQFGPGVVMSFVNASGFWTRFDLQGTTQTLDGLQCVTGGGVIQNERLGAGGTTAPGTLTIGSAANYSYNGYFRDEDDGGNVFPLNLTKVGSGTQTLAAGQSGARIYYTGTTTINAGRIVLIDLNNVSGTQYNSPVVVNSGGILEISSSIPFANRWNYSKALSGAGTINKTGTGVFGIIGANNFAGQINIQGGRIHNDNLTSNWNGSAASVDITAGAQLDLRGDHITVDKLTGSGEVWNTWKDAADNNTNVLTVGIANGTSTFAGIIRGNQSSPVNDNQDSGTVVLTKVGSGTLTLSGANTYNGATNLNGGALTLSGGAAIADNSAVVLANTAGVILNLTASEAVGSIAGGGATGGSITLNANTLTAGANNATTSFDGIIAGGGGLIKTGTGALTLTNVNFYTGATLVNGGTLVGPSGGSVASNVTVAAGATLGARIATTNGQWTCNGLTFDTGTTTADFNFIATGSTTTAPLQVNANLAMNGTTQIAIRATLMAPGTYPLIKYTGTLSGTVPTTPFSLPAHMVATINDNTGNKSIDLVVTTGVAQPLNWAAGNSVWDINTSLNWRDGFGFVSSYAEGPGGNDSVNFEDTFSGPSPLTVTLNSSVAPANVTFNSSKNFTITGTGAIAGTTGLTAQGTGTLQLLGANSYTGQTVVNGATVVIDRDTSVGGVPGVATPGQLQVRSGTLQTAGNVTLAPNRGIGLGPTSGTGAGTFNVGASTTLTISGIMANNGTGSGGLTKAGAGNLILTNNNTNSGANTINAGTLQIGSNGTTGTVGTGNVAINSPGILRLFRSGTGIVLNNNITGNGTWLFSGSGISQSGGYDTIGGINSTFTGNIIMDNARMLIDTQSDIGGATVSVPNGGQVLVNGGTFTNPISVTGLGWAEAAGLLGSMRFAGNPGGTWAGPITLTGDTRFTAFAGGAAGGATNDNGTITGVISGPFNIETTNAGSITYAGTSSNTYTGTTIVNGTGLAGGASNNGTLLLNKTGGAFAIVGPVQMGNRNTLQTNLRMVSPNQFGPGVAITFVNNSGNWSRFDLQGTTQTLDGIQCITGGGIVQNEKLGGGGTTVPGTLTIGGSSDYHYNGYMRDEDDSGLVFLLNLVKVGTGTQTLALGPSGARIYHTGTTTVNGGKLVLVDLNAANGNALNSPLVVNAGGTLEINSNILFAQRWNYAKAISGNGIINKTGPGVFGITNFNTFSGQMNIQAGRIHNDNVTANWTGATANVDVSAGAVLDVRANDMFVNNLTGTGEVWNSNATGNGTGGIALNLGVAGGSSTFAGNIRGNASSLADGASGDVGIVRVTKAGAGTVTLSGTNTYSGATTVNGGGMIASGGSAIGDRSAVTLANTAGVTLTLNASESIGSLAGGGATGGNVNLNANTLTLGENDTTTTYGGIVSGTGGLLKRGGGTQSLTAANTYSGATQINGGKLAVSTGNTYAGNFSVANAASLGIQVTATNSQWAGSNTTFETGFPFLDIDYSTQTVSTTTAPMKVNGNLTLNGNLQLIVRSTTMTVGTYPLVTYTGTLTGAVPMVPYQLPANVFALINHNVGTKTIELVVSASNQPLKWAVGNALWDIGTQFDWTDNAAVSRAYSEASVPGDNVLFDDSTPAAGPITVTLNSTVSPESVTANNATKAYTISGTGAIAGPGHLTKQGTGSFTLSTTNSYTGGSTLTQGALIAGSNTALGTGPIIFNGGTLNNTPATTSLANTIDVNLVAGNSLSIASNLALTGSFIGTGNLNAGMSAASSLTLSGDNSAYPGSITFNNTNGSLFFNAANSGSGLGRWILAGSAAGVNSMALGAGAPGSSTIQLGELSGIGLLSNSRTGSTATYNIGGLNTTSIFSGAFVDSAAAVPGAVTALTKVGTGTLILTGTSTSTGLTNVNTGVLQLGNNGVTGSLAGNISINSPGTLNMFRSGTGIVVNNNVSGNGTWMFSGSGASTQGAYDTIGGNNSAFTGNIVMNFARIIVDNPNDIGAATVSVPNGGQVILSAATINNPISITGNGWFEGAGLLGAIRFLGNTGATWSGPITVNGSSRITAFTGAAANVEPADSGSVTGFNGGPATSVETSGNGMVIISGASPNTYAGTTIMNQGGVAANSNSGALYLNKPAGVAAISGPLQMGAGNANQGNLRMGASNQFAPGVVMTFANLTNNWSRFDLLGTSQTLAGVQATLGGAVIQNERFGAGNPVLPILGATTAPGTLTIGSSANYFYNGYIRDEDDGGSVFPLSLVKVGSGTQTLSAGPSGARVYHTGTTTVNAGRLVLVDLNNVSATLFNSPVVVNSGAILEINSNVPFPTRWNYGKTLSGTGTINKTGPGVFGIGHTTPGIVNFAGQINIQSGRIHNDNLTANWTGSTAAVDISTGAVLDLRGDHISVDRLTGTGEIWNTWKDASDGNINNLTVGVANGSSTFSGLIRGNQSSTVNDNPDSGTLRLIKNGTGTLTLVTSNTFNGGLTANAGLVILNAGNSNRPAGVGTLTINTGGTVTAPFGTGGSAHNQFGNYNNATVIPVAVTGGTLNPAEFNHMNQLSMTGGTITGAGGTGGDGLDFNTSNLVAPAITTLASATAATNASKTTLRTTTTFNIANGAAAIDMQQDGIVVGPGSLTKAGAGVLTLTNANTYTGLTSITNGTLEAANSVGSATGSNIVTVSGSGFLGGSGFIAGAINLNAGGTVSPGPVLGTGLGKLTTGSLTMNAGSTASFQLTAPDNGAANTGGDDEMLINGNLQLGGTVNVAGSGLAAGTYHLMTATGTITGSVVSVTSPPGTAAIVVVTGNSVDLMLNNIPVLASIGPKSVNESSALTFTAAGSDVDAPPQTLTYSLQGTIPAGATIDPVSGAFSWTPTDGPSQTTTVTVRVTDNGTPQRFAQEMITITVNNVAPTATFANGGSVNEGSTGTVTFSGEQDVSPEDTTATFHYSFDFNNDGTFDGGGTTYASALTTPSVTVPAIYFPDGPASLTVRGRVWDKDDGFTDYTTTITVDNVNPAATLSNSGNVDEGTATPTTVSFSGQIDPSAADAAALHYAYDFDNNGIFDVGGPTYLAAITAASAVVPPAFLDDGPFSRVILARVIDKDGGFTDYTTTIVVANVAPIAVVGAIGSATEGGTTSFVVSGQFDPSNADTVAGFKYSYDFNYDSVTPAFDLGGDTLALAVAISNPTIPASQILDGPATQTVLTRVWDKDGGSTDYTSTFTINNVAPALSALNAAGSGENGITVLTGILTDPGVLDTFTVTIDWKDGTIDVYDLLASPTGSQSVLFTHIYLDDDPTGTNFDNYSIDLVVMDNDGDSSSASVLAQVNDIDPVISIPNGLAPVLPEHSSTGLITLATFTDAGTQDTHTVTIDWGDGSPLDLGATLIEPAGATPGQILANHLYDDGPSVRTVTVTVTDDDNGVGVATFNISIDNVAPTAVFQRPDAGSFAQMTQVQFLNPFDPSVADTNAGFLYSYDWDNDGVFEISLSSSIFETIPPQYLMSHPNHIVHGRITDKDGGHSDYYLQQPFFSSSLLEVTFDLGSQSSYTLVATAQPAPNYSIEVVDLPDGIPNLAAIGLSFDGIATISGIPTVGGMVTLHATASNAAGSETVDLVITIKRPVNSNSPQIISQATANPNPCIAGTPVTFSVVATDRDGDVLSYFWDFKDGSTARGRVVTHTYTTPGTYFVVVNVSDGKNDQIHDEFNLIVAKGTDNTFDVQLAKLSFDFRKPERSTLYATGYIPVPSGPIAGVTANVSITGTSYAQAFVFDSKGAAGDTMSLFSVKTIQTGTGTSRAKFIFSLKSTNGLDPLNPSLFQKIGMLFPAKTERAGTQVPVPLVVTIGSQATQTNIIPLVYKVVPNRSGKGAFKRK